MSRAKGLSPASLGRWQCQALVEAVPSRAEREEIKRLRAELKRVKQARDMSKGGSLNLGDVSFLAYC